MAALGLASLGVIPVTESESANLCNGSITEASNHVRVKHAWLVWIYASGLLSLSLAPLPPQAQSKFIKVLPSLESQNLLGEILDCRTEQRLTVKTLDNQLRDTWGQAL